MKYEVEFSGVAQVAYYLEVEADSPEQALLLANEKEIADGDFSVEVWLNAPSVESLTEDGVLIASNYELDIANIEDVECAE